MMASDTTTIADFKVLAAAVVDGHDVWLQGWMGGTWKNRGRGSKGRNRAATTKKKSVIVCAMCECVCGVLSFSHSKY